MQAAREVLTPDSPDREALLGMGDGAEGRDGGVGGEGDRMPWEEEEEGGEEGAGGEVPSGPRDRPGSTPSPVGPWLPDWQADLRAGAEGGLQAGAASGAMAGSADSDWSGLSARETKLVRYVSRLLRQRDARENELRDARERAEGAVGDKKRLQEEARVLAQGRRELQQQLDGVSRELQEAQDQRRELEAELSRAREASSSKGASGDGDSEGGEGGDPAERADGSGLMVWQWVLLVLLAFAGGIAVRGGIQAKLESNL